MPTYANVLPGEYSSSRSLHSIPPIVTDEISENLTPRSDPTIVTLVPPSTGPFFGEIFVTFGLGHEALPVTPIQSRAHPCTTLQVKSVS